MTIEQTAPGQWIDLLQLQAREMLDKGDDWHTYLYEVKDSPYGEFFEVTGVVAPLVTRGKNKGRPNWRKADKSTKATAQISVEQQKLWVAQWEKRTGICSKCFNAGERWTGWSATHGDTYKLCDCPKGVELAASRGGRHLVPGEVFTLQQEVESCHSIAMENNKKQ